MTAPTILVAEVGLWIVTPDEPTVSGGLTHLRTIDSPSDLRPLSVHIAKGRVVSPIVAWLQDGATLSPMTYDPERSLVIEWDPTADALARIVPGETARVAALTAHKLYRDEWEVAVRDQIEADKYPDRGDATADNTDEETI